MKEPESAGHGAAQRRGADRAVRSRRIWSPRVQAPPTRGRVGGLRRAHVPRDEPAAKPWDKKEARQAVAYAIDRDALIKVLLQGQASRLDGPIGPGQYGYDADLQPKYTYNPAKARELLKQAGYPNGVEVDSAPPSAAISPTSRSARRSCPMLEAVGFKVNLKTPEWGDAVGRRAEGRGAVLLHGPRLGDRPVGCRCRSTSRPAARRASSSRTRRSTLPFRPNVKSSMSKSGSRLLRKAMSVITDEAPAHFMWRHKMATGICARWSSSRCRITMSKASTSRCSRVAARRSDHLERVRECDKQTRSALQRNHTVAKRGRPLHVSKPGRRVRGPVGRSACSAAALLRRWGVSLVPLSLWLACGTPPPRPGLSRSSQCVELRKLMPALKGLL